MKHGLSFVPRRSRSSEKIEIPINEMALLCSRKPFVCMYCNFYALLIGCYHIKLVLIVLFFYHSRLGSLMSFGKKHLRNFLTGYPTSKNVRSTSRKKTVVYLQKWSLDFVY